MQKSAISGIFITINAKLWKERDPKQKKDRDMQPENDPNEDTDKLKKRRDKMRSALHIIR